MLPRKHPRLRITSAIVSLLLVVLSVHGRDVVLPPENAQRLKADEGKFSFACCQTAGLNRSFQKIAMETKQRIEMAKKLKLSPENPAVSTAVASLPDLPQDQAPEYTYDATLLTVAAGLESRAYDRGSKELWKTVKLPIPDESNVAAPYYTKEVTAHYRAGSPSSRHLFILLNSSYSTWDRGSWTNKSIALLRAIYGDPHFLVFAGFLTPEFLRSEPILPTLDGALPARDLRWRISHFITELRTGNILASDAEVGLIGFSGGANLVISLLAEDSRRVRLSSSPRPLFDLGGVALSPILDLGVSFDVLDRSSRLLNEEGFPARQALTTPFVGNDLFSALKGYGPTSPLAFLEMARAHGPLTDQRKGVIARFYREFEIVDLATTARAKYRDFKLPAGSEAGASYASYYIDAVYPEYRRLFKIKPATPFFQYTRLERELAGVASAPLYLVFSMDDPVLSVSAMFPDDVSSSRCGEVLKFACSRPSIRVFSPAHGAHLGYMLDSQYITSVFREVFHRN